MIGHAEVCYATVDCGANGSCNRETDLTGTYDGASSYR